MKLLEIKGRVALALVESIFRRAGYALTPVGGRNVPPHLGRDDLPDFCAVREPATGEPPERGGRVVEVRYRPQLAHYLAIEHQRGGHSTFAQIKRHWPNSLFVFFTDYPETGRSSFQVLDLVTWHVGGPIETNDLFEHRELDIYRQNVEEHEALAHRIMTLFSGSDKLRWLG